MHRYIHEHPASGYLAWALLLGAVLYFVFYASAAGQCMPGDLSCMNLP